MKLLSLFTTIIISLASSNVSAKKFLCTNWLTEGQPYEGTMSMSEENNPKEYDGTWFIGQKTGDKVTIRNWLKNELFLIYDRKVASEVYYTISNGDIKHLYSFGTTKVRKGFGKKQLEYDFNLIDKNEKKITYCNWQDEKICDNAYDC